MNDRQRNMQNDHPVWRRSVAWSGYGVTWLAYCGFLLVSLKYFPYKELPGFFLSWGYESWWLALASLVTVAIKLALIGSIALVITFFGSILLPILLLTINLGATPSLGVLALLWGLI